MAAAAVLFFLSFFFDILFLGAVIYTCALLALTAIDYILLFNGNGTVKATRRMPARFSLGDENTVALTVRHTFSYTTDIVLIDEQPEQLQDRNFLEKLTLTPSTKQKLTYAIRPVVRGAYTFGRLLCYVASPLHLLRRRIVVAEPATVKVYPSFLQLKKYQLLATSDNLFTGVKKIRRLGHSLEFEKIKTYVQGDDVRSINWKATARTGGIMVNTYTDARQQQIYSIIDKGRIMKMPFDGMTLLDYAINATLAVLNIALLKHDKAGLITFANTVDEVIPAERRTGQLTHVMEALYKQQTAFKESSYENLWSLVHRKVTQRSFLLLFTNFETMSSLERQLPYLRQLAQRHLLCVVFFQNTLLKEIQETQPNNTEDIYIKTIAERFDFEKKQIVKELRRHGIISILTTPQQLTLDVINKYLELKARQMV